MKEKCKIINPYSRLLNEICEFCKKISNRKIITMWFYKKEDLNADRNLNNLYERVAAAEQLGYEVILVHSEKGLFVEYRMKYPEIPWHWKK